MYNGGEEWKGSLCGKFSALMWFIYAHTDRLKSVRIEIELNRGQDTKEEYEEKGLVSCCSQVTSPCCMDFIFCLNLCLLQPQSNDFKRLHVERRCAVLYLECFLGFFQHIAAPDLCRSKCALEGHAAQTVHALVETHN